MSSLLCDVCRAFSCADTWLMFRHRQTCRKRRRRELEAALADTVGRDVLILTRTHKVRTHNDADVVHGRLWIGNEAGAVSMAQSTPSCRLISCARELEDAPCHVHLALKDDDEQRIDEAIALAADVVRRHDGPVLLFCRYGQVRCGRVHLCASYRAG